MKRIIGIVTTAAVSFALMAPAEAAKPVTVWEDATGDADMGQGLGQSIPAGFDLVSGSLVKNGDNLEFTVTHADMPPSGSFPEAARFLWNFMVGKTPYRLTVKSVDIGKPDVVGGQTTDRIGRADVTGHFRLEGECVTDSSLPLGRVNCPPLAYLEGSFDPAAMSFTVVVPLSEIKAKVGTVIGPGPDQICTICWVSHLAERSVSPSTVIDSAAQLKSYKIPKK